MSRASEPVAEPRRSDEITRSGRPGLVCGSYVLAELIDCGGFSEVWRGRHRVLGREAAVKLLRPEQQGRADSKRRFEQEVQLIAEVHHENVVGFHEAGFCAGASGEQVLWMAMELLEGASLRARLNEGERFTEEEAVRVAYEVAIGVAEAHTMDVIHRDLKPENVFLTGMRVVKVLDFGIAKFGSMWGFRSTGRVSRTLGTVSYMAPEQIDGQPPSFATDVYQICLVLYELLAGHPFGFENGEQPTQTEICAMHRARVPRSLTEFGIHPAVAALVAKGLRKSPKERQADAQALAVELWAALLAVRACAAKRGGPVEEVNPASSKGEPQGQAARRVHLPAKTVEGDAPPVLPTRTVELSPAVAPPPKPKRWEKTVELDRAAPVVSWRGAETTRGPRESAWGDVPRWFAPLMASSAALTCALAIYYAATQPRAASARAVEPPAAASATAAPASAEAPKPAAPASASAAPPAAPSAAPPRAPEARPTEAPPAPSIPRPAAARPTAAPTTSATGRAQSRLFGVEP